MKLHFAFNANTMSSAYKRLVSPHHQEITATNNTSRVVIVDNSRQGVEVGTSIDDFIAELELDDSTKKELATARVELSSPNLKYPSISELRLRLGMSQRELAEKCSLHQPNVSLIEGGKRKPDYETAERLANVLQVSIADLYSAYDAPQSKL